MKKIGITQRIEFIPKLNEVRSSLDLNWGSFFSAAGLNFAPLPFTDEADSNLECFHNFDGFVFSGGGDIASLCEFNKDKEIQGLRDTLEKQILTHCIKNNVPLIGICRGMQQLAYQFGCEFVEAKDPPNSSHSLLMQNECELCLPDEVNSYHSWAVCSDNFPSELTILAFDKHRYVEAFKHKVLPIFGFMWHPERLKCSSKLNTQIFKDIFDAI